MSVPWDEISGLDESWPYAIRYAWAVVRGLPPPPARVEVEPVERKRSAHPQRVVWEGKRDAQLRTLYAQYRNDRNLAELAELLGVNSQSMQTRAAKLGLTQSRHKGRDPSEACSACGEE